MKTLPNTTHKAHRALLALCAALLCVATSAQVFAQDADDADSDAATPAGDSAPETGAKPADDAEKPPSLYWSDRRDLGIFQKRLFTKDGRVEVSVFGGVIPNDSFITYVPLGARVGYYFVESIGVELSGSYSGSFLRVESDVGSYLKEEQRIRADVDVLDRQDWRANATVVWSPFYGKFALLDESLSHFDFNLVAGFGAIQITSPPSKDDLTTEDFSEVREEGVLGAGGRFFINDFLTLRVDYRQYIFRKISGGVLTPSEISLGLSAFFL